MNNENVFLRFTEDQDRDIEHGHSYLDLPSLDNPIKLEGLCGYSFADSFEFSQMTESDIESKIKMYENNTYYPGTPVLFYGEYIKNNPNSEGVVFKPLGLV